MYQIKQYCRRSLDILKQEGFGILCYRVVSAIKRLFGIRTRGNYDHGYTAWRNSRIANLTSTEVRETINNLASTTTFSILLPVYNVKLKWLDEAINSVLSQSYPHWQLCIVDDASDGHDTRAFLAKLEQSDPRVTVRHHDNNMGISLASNAAVEKATGTFLVLLDHDDVLAQDALLEAAKCIDINTEVDIIYSDEDKISESGHFSTPYFKPDFSPELLESQNYFGHLVVIRKSLVDRIGGFRSEYDGAQDYDLLLRAIHRKPNVRHISRVLYHWREIAGSTASIFGAKSYAWDAGLRALESYISTCQIPAKAIKGVYPGTFRLQPVIQTRPAVSVILPFKDQHKLLDNCLSTLFAKSSWQELEVIGINNNSEQPETQAVMERWKDSGKNIRFVDYPEQFNYSAICNFGVKKSAGKYIVLLNSDIEFLSESWLDELFLYAQKPGVGAVGAQLVYPDNTIQHSGIVVGIDGGAGHPFKGFPVQEKGYFMRLSLAHNVSAVTAALLMVERAKFDEVGGLDESRFGVAYNDVDFCLKLTAAGYRNVINPNCRAIHFESRTRGYESDARKRNRQDLEKQELRNRWHEIYAVGDPFYNPNLTLDREDYTLNFRS